MTGENIATRSYEDGSVEIRTRMCWICGQYSYVTMPRKVYAYWDNYDLHIDDAWPDAPAEARNLILTGVHTKCWEQEFGGEKK